MKIAVCLKQVPDTREMRIDPEHNTLIREGVESVLNPLDTFPLEAGLRLKETEAAHVSVFSMGPPQAEKAIHKALAMGADAGYLLSDKRFAGSDTWATSLVLARAIKLIDDFDLILCGKQAIDGDTGQVGPGIAAHLEIPQVTCVVRISVPESTEAGYSLQLQSMLDNMKINLQLPLPAVLTVLKEANEPRLPSLADRLNAFRSEIPLLTADDLKLSEGEIGLKGSPTRVEKMQVPQIQRQQQILHADKPQEVAETLIRVLHEQQ